MTQYPEKIEGQPCSENCGGKNVKNPKTGKVFCERKCWLEEQQPKAPFVSPGEVDKKDKAKWHEIGKGKVKYGFSLEAYKKNKPLNQETITEINKWTAFVMDELPKPVDPPTEEMPTEPY